MLVVALRVTDEAVAEMQSQASSIGTGARFTKDGLSATAYPSGVRGTQVEIAESQTPLIFWKKELRPG